MAHEDHTFFTPIEYLQRPEYRRRLDAIADLEEMTDRNKTLYVFGHGGKRKKFYKEFSTEGATVLWYESLLNSETGWLKKLFSFAPSYCGLVKVSKAHRLPGVAQEVATWSSVSIYLIDNNLADTVCNRLKSLRDNAIQDILPMIEDDPTFVAVYAYDDVGNNQIIFQGAFGEAYEHRHVW